MTATNGSPQPVRAPKTSELIASQLRTNIVRGVLKPGDTLPPETELGKQFGVSRPTLREAFRILENESLIVVRRGSRGGVVVAAPEIGVAARDFGLLLQMAGTTLADVYEARKLLEPPAVRLLTERHTMKDVDDLSVTAGQLAVLVNEGTTGADFGEWAETAYRFHDLIVERSGNNTLAVFSAVLREVNARHISRAVTSSSDPGEIASQFQKTIRAFVKLVGLVRAGDPGKAESFWRTHMELAGKNLLWGALATETVVDLFS